MNDLLYTCAFRREGTTWTAIVLDMPGTITEADSFEDAKTAALDALVMQMQALRDEGFPVPSPRALSDMLDDPNLAEDMEGAVLLQIAAPPPTSRSVRVTFTIDEILLGKIDAQAQAQGSSRSGFLAEGARKLLADA